MKASPEKGINRVTERGRERVRDAVTAAKMMQVLWLMKRWVWQGREGVRVLRNELRQSQKLPIIKLHFACCNQQQRRTERERDGEKSRERKIKRIQ